MEDDIFKGLKGMINYPCGCKARVLVYKGTHGKASVQCPTCGKYALFCYDDMTAVPYKSSRGASRRFKNK